MTKQKKNFMQKIFRNTAVKFPSETGFIASNMMSLDQAWLNNNEHPFAVYTEAR